ncbi:MAG: amino acid adenylation domain-containing protein, partial [Pseudomonadota bacterium]
AASIARMSEAAGCEGSLIYSDHRLADPWLVAQILMASTERLVPLVALQPAYMHPFTVAKLVATLSGWHQRRVDLNLLAGGFKRDLEAMGDMTPHDERYTRLEEYARIIVGLLEASSEGRGFTLEGRYYTSENLRLSQRMDPSLMPRLLVSGSSAAGQATAKALGATAISYPLPTVTYESEPVGQASGLRIGLIARDDESKAWRDAEERFPPDRKGEIAHQMATKISDSKWHHTLSEIGEGGPGNPYWMRPFQSYKTFCPYLVGDYQTVSHELARYMSAGFETFILDVPTIASSDSLLSLLQHLLSAQASARPGAKAIVEDGKSTTFAELEVRSNRLANLLRERGLAPLDRVGVMASKSIDTIEAFIAVLKAGGIYVPLDPAGPATRVGRMIDVAACRMIVHSEEAQAVLSECEETIDRVVDLGTFTQADVAQDAMSLSAAISQAGTQPDDPAHILFTSGSTGLPKGVVITHANVLSFIDWANPYFGRGPEDRVSGHSPLQFDLSTYDIFGSLAAGAELHLVPARLNLFPKDLPNFIRERQLTQWFSAPSVLTYLTRFDAVAQDDFSDLRELLWCGEVFAVPALRYWMERLPHVRFTNLYGPTEATIASTYCTLSTSPKNDRDTTPIGRACGGEEVFPVNQSNAVANPGETGEICIAGPGVTKGYWRDEARTASAFPPVAQGMQSPGRMYRTGDLGYVGEDGDLRFVGRADTQIKSRGHRIELGEIETAANSLGDVAEAAVIAMPVDEFAGTEIACVYSLIDGSQLTANALRRDLSKLIPRYMLPGRYEARKKLPLNSNGKIDRVRLRAELSSTGTDSK